MNRKYVRHNLIGDDYRGNRKCHEEDRTHEFKGHRCINMDEINPNNFFQTKEGDRRPTRQPISKNINGILNTGNGGTIYLGVLDNGQIEGLMMTEDQQDHLKLSLFDTLKRYDPPVPPSFYRLDFIPIVENEEDEVINNDYKKRTTKCRDSSGRKRSHILRRVHHCWCDSDSNARLQSGFISPFYVVEIKIFPWKEIRTYPENSHLVDTELPILSPIFKDEDKNVYLRRNASNALLSESEVQDIIIQRKKHFAGQKK